MIRSIPNILRRGLLCLAGTALAFSAEARFRYKFTATTATYAALGSPTSINGSTIWDDDQYTVPLPFNWVVDSSRSMSSVPVDMGLPAIMNDLNDYSNVTGFLLGFADLIDRGDGGAASLSPISYQVSGTSPNRIFKLEFQNAGFYGDPSLSDYVNYQVWIYETTHIVEIHFGASSVTSTTDYYEADYPAFAQLQEADLDNGSAGRIYYIDGTGSTPTIDTFDFAAAAGLPGNLLPAWPSNGTVYRFTPTWISCARPAASFTAASQSALSVRFSFTAATTGIDSLVWDFGDGQRQKVTTAFAAPITHAYTTAGRYNATVSAYNSCGPTTAGATLVKVAVADIPGLSNVRVYPTVISEGFFVEGLSAGSTIAVYNGMGQQLRQFTTVGTKQPLSLSGLSAGTYLLRMTDKTGSQGSVRIVKQ